MGPRLHQIRVEMLGDPKILVSTVAGELYLQSLGSRIVSDRLDIRRFDWGSDHTEVMLDDMRLWSGARSRYRKGTGATPASIAGITQSRRKASCGTKTGAAPESSSNQADQRKKYKNSPKKRDLITTYTCGGTRQRSSYQ
jgi:hypothetical protein